MKIPVTDEDAVVVDAVVSRVKYITLLSIQKGNTKFIIIQETISDKGTVTYVRVDKGIVEREYYRTIDYC